MVNFRGGGSFRCGLNLSPKIGRLIVDKIRDYLVPEQLESSALRTTSRNITCCQPCSTILQRTALFWVRSGSEMCFEVDFAATWMAYPPGN